MRKHGVMVVVRVPGAMIAHTRSLAHPGESAEAKKNPGLDRGCGTSRPQPGGNQKL